MNAVLPAIAGRSPWPRALGGLLIGLVLILGLYQHTFAAMVAIWARSDTFAHGFLVAPISIWLVWRRRSQVANLVPRPQPLWLVPLALAALAWLVGDLAGVNSLTQLAATAMLVLAVPTLLGTAVARSLLFPLAFLFFMVPIGEFMLPQLMVWTADFTVAALAAVGVPVYREGLQFVIPSGTWSVVEECSGVRYLIASFMVGTLFAYLNYRSPRRRLVFSVVSLIVPVVANWLRAFMIVMLGHLSGNKLAVGVDHLLYGWVFFGVVIMLMFTIGARWSEPDEVAPPNANGPLGNGAYAAPASAPWLALTAAILVLVVGLPRWASAEIHAPGAEVAGLQLPALPGTAEGTPPTDYTPVFDNPTAQAQRSYAAGDRVVTVHAAYYRQQTYGRKLSSSLNLLVKFNDPRWHQVSDTRRGFAVGQQTVDMREAELRGGGVGSGSNQPGLLVRQVFWVDGHLTASPSRATLYAVMAQLMGRGDDSAALTFHVPSTDPAAARATLDEFIAKQLPPLVRAMEAVRDKR